jgi:hypothetical protein
MAIEKRHDLQESEDRICHVQPQHLTDEQVTKSSMKGTQVDHSAVLPHKEHLPLHLRASDGILSLHRRFRHSGRPCTKECLCGFHKDDHI